MRKSVATLALAMTLAPAAMAHANELWVQQKGNGLQVVCAPSVCAKEVQPVPCEAATIKEVTAYAATGKVLGKGSDFKEKAALETGEGKVALVTVFQDEGFRAMTPEGEKSLSKKAAGDALETRYYLNYSKTLLAWGKAFTRPLGRNLEIVPLRNPLVLKPGDKLPIAVFFAGKPKAGVWVDDRTNDGIREKTDHKGRLQVTIGKQGLQVITAYLDTPYKDPAEADKLTRTANLVYSVK